MVNEILAAAACAQRSPEGAPADWTGCWPRKSMAGSPWVAAFDSRLGNRMGRPAAWLLREPRRFRLTLTFGLTHSKYLPPAAGPPMRGFPARL